jgi:hypothetical protein
VRCLHGARFDAVKTGGACFIQPISIRWRLAGMYDFGADALGLGSDLRLESALFGLL